MLGDERPGAVGPDQVLGPDGVGRPGQPVPHGGGHAVVVLLVAQVLGREPALGAAGGGVLDQDRLQVGLRDVADQAGRGELVVGLAGRVGAPGLDPADLLARDRRAEHGVADQFVRGRVGEHLVLDAEVAKDLHRPLVGDVRAGGVGRPPVLGDHDVRHPEGGQAERRRAAGRPRADDQHIGLDHRAGRDLGLGDSVVEGRHPPHPSPGPSSALSLTSLCAIVRAAARPRQGPRRRMAEMRSPLASQRDDGLFCTAGCTQRSIIGYLGLRRRRGGRRPGGRSDGGRRVRNTRLT